MSIEVEQRGHLLVMGMRRPQKMNALSRDMYRSLARALYRLEHDPELWVGVIWAVGPHFTSGVDLNDWADAFASGTPFPIGDGEIDPFSLSGPRLSKPLVIAVQGRCYTWGWELLLNTDLRVAASDTRFAMLEVRRGFDACGGATLRLPTEIGWANAQRYLLTGDELGAARRAGQPAFLAHEDARGRGGRRRADVPRHGGSHAQRGRRRGREIVHRAARGSLPRKVTRFPSVRPRRARCARSRVPAGRYIPLNQLRLTRS